MLYKPLLYLYIHAEPECGTAGKLLLLACEDGVLRGCDVRNKETVSLTTTFTYNTCTYVATVHVQVVTCPIGEGGLSSCVMVNETEALVGNERGVLATVDLRTTQLSHARVYGSYVYTYVWIDIFN